MNVLMISPGYPPEMPFFTRGLAEVGATVVGIGDSPEGALPAMARESLSGYAQVRTLWDEGATIAEVRRLNARVPFDRIECLWEPGMMLAARLLRATGSMAPSCWSPTPITCAPTSARPRVKWIISSG